MKIIRKPDYDLEYCWQHDCERKIEEIVNVLAQVPGEADGPNWHWIVKLSNGNYGYITGGCDYSGWGCQDWGSVVEAKTAIQAAKLVEEEKFSASKKSIKQQLLDQLKGKQPYALREE